MKRIALDEGWQLAGTAPGAFTRPERLAAAALAWKPAQVPGTVAASLDADPVTGGDWDARDWWYRATFAAPPLAGGARVRLCFAGLATLAHVWLNGEMILDSRNMFRRHRVDVTARLRDVNQLAIRFASLCAAAEAAPRRPRARWKTALAQPQELRHFRTTLLGRMPGWTPALAPVGPWRAISLEVHEGVELAGVRIAATVHGESPRIAFHADLVPLGAAPDGAWLHLGDFTFPLRGLSRDRPGTDPGQTTCSAWRDAVRVHGEFEVPGAPLWWPHTHGTAALLPCRLAVQAGGARHEFALAPVGFRALRVDETGGQVRFEVNGVPVFCRGASWTPLDARSMQAPRAELRRALEQVRDAGANMLRVPGTLAYESDDFYRLCDELGLLVWQDFMFANFDYPLADEAFRAEAMAEADDVLDRLHAHACIAAYCGGSEVAQQAAMMGLPPAQWDDGFFTRELRGRCAARHPGVPYFPSTPWGGALPFHVGTGLAHYYGVGAYRRPLEDARLAQVKFAPECLAFAHVPEPETIEGFMPTAAAPVHHPRWKARVPRDPGSGWDFEDVRDHYLRALWNVDPAALRSEDPRRYLQLSRVATGEVMRRVYAEWRAPGSSCGGALAWLLRDLVPGAGWGLVDAHGLPKAAWWALARAWAPRAVLLTDRGLDGLAIHVLNDAAEPLEGTLELQLLRDGRPAMPGAACAVAVAPHDARTWSADALLGRFTDCTHAYRFGPPKVDVVAARLRGGDGATLAEDFHFPLGPALARAPVAGVQSAATWREDGGVELALESPVFLQFVALACPGFTPSDNHFHMAPGVEKRVVLVPHRRDTAQLDATLEPLNATAPIAVRARREGSAPAPQRLGLRPFSP